MSIIYNGKNSLEDFDLYVASRDLTPPKKKRITETLPFFNGNLDFSKIGGEQYYEEREVKYTFDIIGNSKAEIESIREDFTAWILNEAGSPFLYDSDIPNYFFNVLNTDVEFEISDLQATATAIFYCYPFMISEEKRIVYPALTSSYIQQYAYNNGSRRVYASIIVSDTVSLYINGVRGDTYTAGTHENFYLLPVGSTRFKALGSGSCEIVWREEVI